MRRREGFANVEATRYAKRKAEWELAETVAKRHKSEEEADFTDYTVEFYLRNKLSALETKLLAQTSQRAGARGVDSLARPCLPRNSQRSLMRGLLKATHVPNLYWAKVPTRDPVTLRDGVMTDMPFILPHELLQHAVRSGSTTIGQLANSHAEGLTSKKAEWRRERGTLINRTIGLGLHGDGLICTHAHMLPACSHTGQHAHGSAEGGLMRAGGQSPSRVMPSCATYV